MRFLRRILFNLRSRKAERAGRYDSEVLFSGWVELPAAFRAWRRRPDSQRKPGSG